MRRVAIKIFTFILAILMSMPFLPQVCAVANLNYQSARADVWNGEFVVNGCRAFLVDDCGYSECALCYNGIVYVPLSTMANWLGMKEAPRNEQTFFLSNSGESIVSSWDNQGKHDFGKESTLENTGVSVTEIVDATIFLNNQEIKMAFPDGRTLYPIKTDDSVYLPVRIIFELAGYEVAWAADKNNYQSIYIRKPLGVEEQQKVKTYIEVGYSICDKMDQLEDNLRNTPEISSSQIDTILQEQQSLLHQVETFIEENSDLEFLKYTSNSILEITNNITTNIANLNSDSLSRKNYGTAKRIILASRIHIRGELEMLQEAFDQKGIFISWD